MQEGGRGEGNKKRGREFVGKAAGDECVFIPGDGPSWQMRSAIPEAAGGEGGHGAANRMA